MKKTNASNFPVILISLTCLALSIQSLKSQNDLATNTPRLTGSALKSEDLILKSDAIFVGTVTQIFPPSAAEAGVDVFEGVQVKILSVLRGSLGANVAITLPVISNERFQEDAPKVGSSYIFFVKVTGAEIRVLKLLPATDATTATVQKLMPSSQMRPTVGDGRANVLSPFYIPEAHQCFIDSLTMLAKVSPPSAPNITYGWNRVYQAGDVSIAHTATNTWYVTAVGTPSGSGLKLNDAVIQADSILTGTLLDLGVKSFKSDGVLIYHHTRIKPVEILRGTFDASTGVKLSKMISAKEELPTAGQEYIFFLKKRESSSPVFTR